MSAWRRHGAHVDHLVDDELVALEEVSGLLVAQGRIQQARRVHQGGQHDRFLQVDLVIDLLKYACAAASTPYAPRPK